MRAGLRETARGQFSVTRIFPRLTIFTSSSINYELSNFRLPEATYQIHVELLVSRCQLLPAANRADPLNSRFTD
jgi:hypothetical protein